ncbi:MAG: gamma-glutamyltransferase [Microvirga sp.]
MPAVFSAAEQADSGLAHGYHHRTASNVSAPGHGHVPSQAGIDVLRAGGSAIDAAIAASATLAVIYPHMTGVGGDAFWLIYDAKADAVRHLNGGGKAARSADLQWFTDRGLSEIPYRGAIPATLTVPGSVASWCEARRTYGKVPLERCLEAAIDYAEHGFPVTERLASWISLTSEDLQRSPEAAAIFLATGAQPKPGTVLKNPDLARTLQALASSGAAGFYEGEIADELTHFARTNDGFFDREDLRNQNAEWSDPISVTYRDVTIFETPAPTQGFTVLQMLKLLEPYELSKRPFLGPDHVHLMVQAKQLAYHDRDRWLADPRFVDVPIEQLLSDRYLAKRRELIDLDRAIPWDQVPSYGSLAGDTIYIAAIDQEGNAASLIQSLYWGFGSAVVAGRTGVVLQNRAAYFSLSLSSLNKLEPGKIPQLTLIASLAFRNHKLWAILGCMGADGQPQIHLQTYLSLLDYGRNIQEALETPRFLSGRFALGEARDTLHIEARFPEQTISELARRGHPIDRWGDWNELAGHAHGILIAPKGGVRAGGSDPRSDGAAIGY